jgi:hypothetical protein
MYNNLNHGATNMRKIRVFAFKKVYKYQKPIKLQREKDLYESQITCLQTYSELSWMLC